MTPEQARALWALLLGSVTEERPFNPVLQHVLMSVLVDIVEKRIELSDTFAVTIGNRIKFLTTAIREE